MPRVTFILIVALFLTPLRASADTINACVRQSSGKLRIVGVPGQCKSNEAPISWKSDGAIGPEGPQGPAGPQGPQGNPAPASPRFELVGFTSSTFDGGEGVLGFTLACQAEFSGSRMCNSVEVMETVNVPVGLTGEAWVRPVFEGENDNSGAISSFGNLGCTGWSNTLHHGLVVNSSGSFRDRQCFEFHSVACCAPVP